MESYATPDMGCTSSTERSEDALPSRRAHEVSELLVISGQQPLLVGTPHGMNSIFQTGHLTLSTQIQIPSADSNLPDQNDSQDAPRPSFLQANQQYQDLWETRGSETYYRFEHFHNLDARRHGRQQTTELQEGTDPGARMDSIKKPSMKTKLCSICLDQISEQDSLDSNFPYSCERFCGQVICITCLKDWFIDSCKNESKMPPRCCCTVPLSAVSHVLSKDQVELYKAKFEEWRTPDRFYCPVSTCSSFIPPRLIKEGLRQMKKQALSGRMALQSQNENLNPNEKQIISSSASFNEQYFFKKDIEVNHSAPVSSISVALSTTMCPKCTVAICTRCRQLQHPEAACPQTDLDTLLAAQLEKWKIKRCPKCRAGVRKMFGCAHIECRCGAHFCFACLEPIKKCDGQCDGNDFDDDDDDMSYDDWDSEDVDALVARNGTELDLGVEPYNPTVDTWSCNHNFKPVYKLKGFLSNGRILNPDEDDNSLDCQVCWKVLSPHLPPTGTKILGYDFSGLFSSPDVLGKPPGWVPMTNNGEPAWICMGKHLLCHRCPRDAMVDAKASKYRCECKVHCLKCEKDVEGDKKQLDGEGEESDADLAYDCGCGMIVCGACKVKLEDELDES